MESRLLRLFLTGTYTTLFGMLVMVSTNTQAADPLEKKTEQIILPELERREIKQASVDADDFEIGGFAGALSIEDFGVNPVYGVRLAYHLSEDIFAEIAAAQSKASETSFEVLSGGLQLLTEDERKLTYYNISIGYNLFSGESFFGKRAYNSDVFLIAGVGNTTFANSDNFTWNLGLGYRFIPRDWYTIRVDIRDHIFNSDVLGADKQTHNLEITAGFSFFF